MAKNIMVIDGAENCAYDCFEMSDSLFGAVFPEVGQNIEFIEDFMLRDPNGEYDREFSEMWKRPVAKTQVAGIHGILFYELPDKKPFYPNKRDSDLDFVSRSFSVDELEKSSALQK